MKVLHTLHMDLCGLMRVQSINGKKYILVVIDDYSRFAWVKFLRSKDETSEFVIKFLKQIQVGLNKTVRNIRTDTAGTPSSVTIDQDALSTSHSPSSSEVQPHISHQGVAVRPTIKDNPFAQVEDDPFVNVIALEPSSEESS
ncbi:retrovirus-related pol polyprotein from transposon TNT 1-94 [Tanacetum coccineum]